MRNSQVIKNYMKRLAHLEGCKGDIECGCGLNLIKGRVEQYGWLVLYINRVEGRVRHFSRAYDAHINLLSEVTYSPEQDALATFNEGVARRELIDAVEKGYFFTRASRLRGAKDFRASPTGGIAEGEEDLALPGEGPRSYEADRDDVVQRDEREAERNADGT